MCDLIECRDYQHKCKDDLTDRGVEKLWVELEDISTDENDCLSCDWK